MREREPTNRDPCAQAQLIDTSDNDVEYPMLGFSFLHYNLGIVRNTRCGEDKKYVHSDIGSITMLRLTPQV